MAALGEPVTLFYDLYWRHPHWLFKTILRPFGRRLGATSAPRDETS